MPKDSKVGNMVFEPKTRGHASNPAILVAGAILIAFVVLQSLRYWSAWGIDMSALYFGAWFVANGQPELLYGAPESFFGSDIPPEWRALANDLGHPDDVPLPYVYPPIWAWILGPLAHGSDPAAFFNTTRAILFVSYAAAIAAAWKLMAPRIALAPYVTLAVVASILTVPFFFAALLTQPQILITALTLWAVERYVSGHSKLAGIFLGLAAAIKVTPVLLILIFAVDRDWKATGWTLGVSGGIATLSVLIMGWPAHLAFLEQLKLIDSLVPILGLNLTYEVLAMQVLGVFEENMIPGQTVVAANIGWISFTSKILMLTTAALCLWWTHPMAPADRARARLILLIPVLSVFSPLAWAHYFMPTLLLMLASFGLVSGRVWLICNGLLLGAFNLVVCLPLLRTTDDLQAAYQIVAMPALAASLLVFAAGLRRQVTKTAAPPMAVPAE